MVRSSRRLGALLMSLILGMSQAAKYLIGTDSNSGAFEVSFDETKTLLDLEGDCHSQKSCPPVIIMVGSQQGTIELKNCETGVMYSFINHSENDAGITVQQEGGMFGAKGIPQYGVGTCFCYKERTMMCG
eukprot:gnl/MRDRNA2_/MRDRNA2_94471_c0_seq1.p1 gnl/MRDRNA2_/MRDRNA2_94471_c0~~gnl/MRDRNA2_/MRDRNA2_94471_c0_seq1.p1  ORF type:complete len:130 (+),score=18.73 gnl/MRDRNA2_/MRDRNA2_94471_c0_seq1:64-453(+)